MAGHLHGDAVLVASRPQTPVRRELDFYLFVAFFIAGGCTGGDGADDSVAAAVAAADGAKDSAVALIHGTSFGSPAGRYEGQHCTHRSS